jgi:hypothetical protein
MTTATTPLHLARQLATRRLAGDPPDVLASLERDLAAAEDAAFEAMRERAKDEVRQAFEQREKEALGRRERETIERILRVLRDRGPLQSGVLQTMGIPGVSHSSLRPLLRAAVDQGLVTRHQSGRNVIWTAVTPD